MVTLSKIQNYIAMASESGEDSGIKSFLTRSSFRRMGLVMGNRLWWCQAGFGPASKRGAMGVKKKQKTQQTMFPGSGLLLGSAYPWWASPALCAPGGGVGASKHPLHVLLLLVLELPAALGSTNPKRWLLSHLKSHFKPPAGFSSADLPPPTSAT